MNYLKQPCSYFTNSMRVSVFNSVLSALMLLFYEPFDYHLNGWKSLFELVVFMLIVFVFSFLFFYLLPQKCDIYHKFGNWTIGKNLVYLSSFLLCIGIAIFFFDFHIISNRTTDNYGSPLFYDLLFTDVIGTFSIGVIPLAFSYLLEKVSMLRQTLAGREEDIELYAQQRMPEDNGESHEDGEIIHIQCDHNNTIAICPSEIELLEAAGNYVCIYCFHEKMEKTMVRATLLKLEEQLSAYPYLVRCHRTFIININAITKFYRRKEGYRLHFQHYSDEIPVSRTYLSQVKSLLQS